MRTKEEVIKWFNDEEIEFVRLQFTDLFGMIKSLNVTLNQLEKALDGRVMFDGSAIDGFARIEESDMFLCPDMNTAAILPLKATGNTKTARLICDVYKSDGTPFEGDPRYILKKEIRRAAELGYTFQVGPECEFFMFHTDDNGMPTTITHDLGGYFDIGPIDRGENARKDIVLALEEMGFEIESSHHEMSPAQHEIDFKYSDALSIADSLMTFKMIVKLIAKQKDLHATFMPKPKMGTAGSGMHTNMSLSKDGKNSFFDEQDDLKLSEDAYYFIGGIMKHIKGITAVTNPLVNSYKRLIHGFEAPVYIAWSATNRSPLIRIPAARGESTRMELRSPDPSCNPYLAFALCLGAGIDGIKHKIAPPKSVNMNIFNMTEDDRRFYGIESLPETLSEALKCMEEDSLVRSVLGDHVFSKYISTKRDEWDEYRAQITPWEVDKYLFKI